MFMQLISHIACAWFAFLIPSFETFKALSHRPLSEPELERWIMYWAVVGAFVGFEYAAEWLVSWLPFYWEVKTLFLLFLALPQTQGSTYIYKTHLQPFFVKNEADLDAGITAVQGKALIFIQTHLTTLWQYVSRQLNKSQTEATANGTVPADGTNQTATPAGIVLQNAMDMFRSYAPAFMGSMHQKKDEPLTPPRPSFATTSARASSVSTVIPESRVPLPETPGIVRTAPPPFPEAVHY